MSSLYSLPQCQLWEGKWHTPLLMVMRKQRVADKWILYDYALGQPALLTKRLGRSCPCPRRTLRAESIVAEVLPFLRVELLEIAHDDARVPATNLIGAKKM